MRSKKLIMFRSVYAVINTMQFRFTIYHHYLTSWSTAHIGVQGEMEMLREIKKAR
jgi:hypothetical protein